jgi:uncharacterized alkaline shock family protein YloU
MVEKTTKTQPGGTQSGESKNDTQSSNEVATKENSPLVTEQGRTTIADGVVAKIAGLAARDVVGVHAMGSGLARTFGAVRDRVPGSAKSATRGVKAEVGEVQTALDLDIVVEYGVSIAEVSRTVRENVISAVERMTGLEVVEVNIAVGDVKLPDDLDEETDDEGRPPLQ